MYANVNKLLISQFKEDFAIHKSLIHSWFLAMFFFILLLFLFLLYIHIYVYVVIRMRRDIEVLTNEMVATHCCSYMTVYYFNRICLKHSGSA